MEKEKTYQEGYADGLYAALTATKEPSLSSGSACFLIRDSSLKNMYAPFYNWLRDNGFSKWNKGHGYYSGVDWVYININSKLFNPGMPGVSLTAPVGHHAITIAEFQTIFPIFEKYKDKKPLDF